MNANDVEQNCSDSSKPNICPDDNANSKCDQPLISSSKGAIPKTKSKHAITDKSLGCTKLNNNFQRNCCKMGLGNGNDPNLDLINKVTKDIDPYNLKQTSLNGTTVTSYFRKCNNRSFEIEPGASSSQVLNCDKCGICLRSKLQHSIESDSLIISSNVSETISPEDVKFLQPGPSNTCDSSLQENCTNYEQANRLSISDSSKSSRSELTDSESEDTSLSISDDGCVYTYKGDNFADLPDSFFIDDRPPLPENFPLLPRIDHFPQPRARSRESSPEMDYLEMDFDPGPSCEADSESSVDIDLDDQHVKNDICESQQIKASSNECNSYEIDLSLPSTSTGIQHKNNSNVLNYYGLTDISTQRTNSDEQTPDGSECSFKIADQLLYNDCLEQSLAYSIFQQQENRPLTPLLILDEKDVQQKQFNLLHAGCVTNAVLNALLILDKIPSRIIPEWANQHLMSNSQNDNFDDMDLMSFLFAKSQSLPGHEQLIAGLKQITNGNVYTRFFSTWPERNFSLSHWLKYWLEHQVIPIVTINQQVLTKDVTVPEWQHHAVFGVNTSGIYLTDPVQCVPEDALFRKLTSDSILLIKRSDILSRWNKETDLGPLYSISVADKRWNQVNTLGKLVHLLREAKGSTSEKCGVHICHSIPVPTSVRAGITLVTSVDNPACDMMEYCPELPIKKQTSTQK